MSKEKKVLGLRILFGVLIASLLLLGVLTVLNIRKINRLEDQIDNLKLVNESLLDSSVDEFVILNFVDVDGSITPFQVNKNLGLSIYEFLLTTNLFSDDDFNSLDGEHFFFKNTAGLASNQWIETGVLELEDNLKFYEHSEYGKMLVVGLQKIILTQNYTVVRSINEY